MPLKRYAQFAGRARRKEYWLYVLLLLIVSTLLQVIENMAGFKSVMPGTNALVGPQVGGTGPLSGLFGLAVLVPSIAVTVRRLHDTNRSGWWAGAFFGMYFALIALAIGWVFSLSGTSGAGPNLAIVAAMGVLGLAVGIFAIVILVFMCFDGTRGANRFGADPKGVQNLSEVFS